MARFATLPAVPDWWQAWQGRMRWRLVQVAAALRRRSLALCLPEVWRPRAGRLLSLVSTLYRRPGAGRVLVLAALYFLLLGLAELLSCTTQDSFPAWGQICYALVWLLFLLHAWLSWDRPWRALPLVLSFVPGLRLLLESLGPAGRAAPLPFLALGLPLLGALGVVLGRLGVIRSLPAAGPVALGGFLVAVVLLGVVAQIFAAGPGGPSLAAAIGRGGGTTLFASGPAWVSGNGLAAASAIWRGRPAPLSAELPEALSSEMGRSAVALLAGASGQPEAAAWPAALTVGGAPVGWSRFPLETARRAPDGPRSLESAAYLRRATPAPEPGDNAALVLASSEPPVLPPDCPSSGFDNMYPRGVCTWYAKERRPDLPSFSWDYGLAMYWPQAARLCGFRVDEQPAVGAVIVFPPGANGADVGGHVGYVEAVGDDYLLISECNVYPESPCHEEPIYWVGGYLCANRRISFGQLDPGVAFIHGPR